MSQSVKAAKGRTITNRNAAGRLRPKSMAEPSAQLWARHLIQFDADDASTYGAHTLPMAAMMRSSARSPIAWPKGKEPVPAPPHKAPSPVASLPQCDYLIVTWTTEEAKCLADTLTPGYPSKTAWFDYTHKFASEFEPIIRRGAPAVEDSHRLGSYFPTTIAGKRVLCFKSELHMSQDGPKLPVAKLWKQLIAEVKPKLVITTGTAGGIGPAIELGDVVVAPAVRFDCTTKFKSEPWHSTAYPCSKLKTASFAVAERLFAANQGHLPAARRPLKIFAQAGAAGKSAEIVTTDFFAFDDTSNDYGLQGLGLAVEMGDAVLGLVISELGAGAPKWAAVRNASDPQIDSRGLDKKQAGTKAAQIYERFGYWTTISSAITCWALVVDN
jgi:nucleoside phosphorylase